jgi:hypothetical protein
MNPHQVSEPLVRALTSHLLASAEEFPEPFTANELTSAVFTLCKMVMMALLDVSNTPFNRQSLLDACAQLEMEVWNMAPKTDKN